jgi:hypothetical protein
MAKLTACEAKALLRLQAQELKEKKARARKREKKREQRQQTQSAPRGQVFPSMFGIQPSVPARQMEPQAMAQSTPAVSPFAQSLLNIGFNTAQALLQYHMMNRGQWNRDQQERVRRVVNEGNQTDPERAEFGAQFEGEEQFENEEDEDEEDDEEQQNQGGDDRPDDDQQGGGAGAGGGGGQGGGQGGGGNQNQNQGAGGGAGGGGGGDQGGGGNQGQNQGFGGGAGGGGGGGQDGGGNQGQNQGFGGGAGGGGGGGQGRGGGGAGGGGGGGQGGGGNQGQNQGFGGGAGGGGGGGQGRGGGGAGGGGGGSQGGGGNQGQNQGFGGGAGGGGARGQGGKFSAKKPEDDAQDDEEEFKTNDEMFKWWHDANEEDAEEYAQRVKDTGNNEWARFQNLYIDWRERNNVPPRELRTQSKRITEDVEPRTAKRVKQFGLPLALNFGSPVNSPTPPNNFLFVPDSVYRNYHGFSEVEKINFVDKIPNDRQIPYLQGYSNWLERNRRPADPSDPAFWDERKVNVPLRQPDIPANPIFFEPRPQPPILPDSPRKLLEMIPEGPAPAPPVPEIPNQNTQSLLERVRNQQQRIKDYLKSNPPQEYTSEAESFQGLLDRSEQTSTRARQALQAGNTALALARAARERSQAARNAISIQSANASDNKVVSDATQNMSTPVTTPIAPKTLSFTPNIYDSEDRRFELKALQLEQERLRDMKIAKNIGLPGYTERINQAQADPRLYRNLVSPVPMPSIELTNMPDLRNAVGASSSGGGYIVYRNANPNFGVNEAPASLNPYAGSQSETDTGSNISSFNVSSADDETWTEASAYNFDVNRNNTSEMEDSNVMGQYNATGETFPGKS